MFKKFDIISIILFGSIVRFESNPDSDVDLLIITKILFSRFERHKITDLVFEINLKYNTNFSTLVIDMESWESGPISVLPIHNEILKDGIAV